MSELSRHHSGEHDILWSPQASLIAINPGIIDREKAQPHYQLTFPHAAMHLASMRLCSRRHCTASSMRSLSRLGGAPEASPLPPLRSCTASCSSSSAVVGSACSCTRHAAASHCSAWRSLRAEMASPCRAARPRSFSSSGEAALRLRALRLPCRVRMQCVMGCVARAGCRERRQAAALPLFGRCWQQQIFAAFVCRQGMHACMNA